MKNLTTRAVALSGVLMIATFTQPAAALPRYAYQDIYFDADMSAPGPYGTMYCKSFETGRDTMSCSGVHERSGVLEGRFHYSYQYECSSHELIEDQWYLYIDDCGAGHWIPVGGANCYTYQCRYAI